MTVVKQLFIIGLLVLTTALSVTFPAMAASTDDAGCSYEYFTPVPEAGAQALNGKLYGEITLSREYEPGWYYLTIPYQTEGDRNAQFAAYVVCSGQPRSNVSPWQHFSTSNKWTTLVMVVKLERKIVPVLIFNKSETMGKIDKLLVKTPVLTPVSLPPGTNWFQGNGYFQGVDGELPVGWTHNYTDMSPAVNGLTADFGFEQSTRVMKLGGSDNAPATLESVLFPFPDGGEVEFSVWAKSVDGPARINMLLLGDDYKWSASERFQLSEKWQKYTVRCAVPKKIEKTSYLWCRIDIEKGQHALLGRVELKQPDLSIQKK